MLLLFLFFFLIVLLQILKNLRITGPIALPVWILCELMCTKISSVFNHGGWSSPSVDIVLLKAGGLMAKGQGGERAERG